MNLVLSKCRTWFKVFGHANISEVESQHRFLLFSLVHHTGSLSARLHYDVDKMGRTVALNANAMVRSVVKTCLMLVVMLRLSWELTVLTCIEMPLQAIIQKKHITLSKVGKMTSTSESVDETNFSRIMHMGLKAILDTSTVGAQGIQNG